MRSRRQRWTRLLKLERATDAFIMTTVLHSVCRCVRSEESVPNQVSNDCWLGANVIVPRGVEIGPGSIVAAGAVVTSSVPAYEIWGGVPARRIGTRALNAVSSAHSGI
jgi:acetyltransferase-like isoleucine patch superfamily enzyme